MFLAIFFQPIEAGVTIVIGKENIFAPITALSDVMGYSGETISG
jgi:hypothetical protein